VWPRDEKAFTSREQGGSQPLSTTMGKPAEASSRSSFRTSRMCFRTMQETFWLG